MPSLLALLLATSRATHRRHTLCYLLAAYCVAKKKVRCRWRRYEYKQRHPTGQSHVIACVKRGKFDRIFQKEVREMYDVATPGSGTCLLCMKSPQFRNYVFTSAHVEELCLRQFTETLLVHGNGSNRGLW